MDENGNDWLIKVGNLNMKPKIKYQVTIQSNKLPQILHYTFTEEQLDKMLEKLRQNLKQGGIEDFDLKRDEEDHSVFITIDD